MKNLLIITMLLGVGYSEDCSWDDYGYEIDNMHWEDCGTHTLCMPTCSDPEGNTWGTNSEEWCEDNSDTCFEGCYCDEGYVPLFEYDLSSEFACIPLEDCAYFLCQNVLPSCSYEICDCHDDMTGAFFDEYINGCEELFDYFEFGAEACPGFYGGVLIADECPVYCDACPDITCLGDISGDYDITVVDIVVLMDAINAGIGDTPVGQCDESGFGTGDLNQDEDINILDIVTMVNWILDDSCGSDPE